MGNERSFWNFSPDTDARLYVQFRHAEGDYRGSVYRERLPKWTQKLRGLAKGIVAYKMENKHGDGEHTVYVGEPQALIDSKIAPAEIMHQTYMRRAPNGSARFSLMDAIISLTMVIRAKVLGPTRPHLIDVPTLENSRGHRSDI